MPFLGDDPKQLVPDADVGRHNFQFMQLDTGEQTSQLQALGAQKWCTTPVGPAALYGDVVKIAFVNAELDPAVEECARPPSVTVPEWHGDARRLEPAFWRGGGL